MQPEGGEIQRGSVVLVADDDPIFRSLVIAQLRNADARAIEAQEGASAWQLIREHNIDLAIVDLEMPGLDGLALVRCLRTHPRTQHIPIVMCTSHSDLNTMTDAIEAGVSSFLTKPVNWSLFVPHVRHLLHMSRSWGAVTQQIGRLEAEQARKDALAVTLLAEVRDLVKTIEAASCNQPSLPAAPSTRILTAALGATREALNHFSAAYSGTPATSHTASKPRRSSAI
jgi:CheY-like chemotaxis protein